MEKYAVVRTMTVGASDQLSWGNNRPTLLGIGTTNSPTLWDPATSKMLAKLEGHASAVTVGGFASNGKLLATGSADKEARVWDVPSGKLLRTLGDHTGGVSAIALSGDGKLATGSPDKKVRVWAATGDQPTQTLTGHRNKVTAIAWSRDNRTLATGGDDRDVILWSADKGKQTKTLDHPNEVQALVFSPDGTKLAVGSVDDRLRVYQVAAGKLIHTFEAPGSPPNVSSVAWSADGNFVLGGRGNHTIQYWSLKANNYVQSIGTMAPVASVAVSSDGKTLVAASLDRAVRFWDTGTGKVKNTVISDAGQVVTIAADGNYRSAKEAECGLVAVVQTDKGQETLSLKEFATKYGYRNSPGAVK